MSEQILKLTKMMEDEVIKYNQARAENDLAKMTAAETEVKDLTERYRTQAQNDLFEKCAAAEKPLYEAIKAGFYTVVRPRMDREDGEITGMSLTTAERQIDLLSLFRHLQLDRTWLGHIDRLGMLLCKRVVSDVAGSAQNVERTYRLSNNGKKCDMKGDPMSNSGLLKLLQTTVDAIYFEDDGTGKNVLKVNNKDVKYLLHCYAGHSGKLALRTANTGTLTRLIAEIMYRVVNDMVYDVKFKIVTDNPVLAAQKAANAKAKAEKAAKSAEVSESKSEPASDTIVVDRPAPAEEAAA